MQRKSPSVGFLIILTMALLAPSVAAAQETPLLKNGSFEDRQPETPDMPQAWRADKAEAGYALTMQDVHDGKLALEISFNEKISTAGYAGTIQSITLPNLSGRTLVVTGWLKRSNVLSTAGLWMSFFDAEGKRTTYVNDYYKPWTDIGGLNLRTIEAKVPENTVRMLVGASISGKTGKLIVDAVSLEPKER